MGSGVVALNFAPPRAILADTNEHIIRLYRAIHDQEISGAQVREYLELHGKRLEEGGANYYYEVRQRFNERSAPLDFLFLNRSCFNGVMRFNSKGKFNVPFCHKPERFSKAYITKIVNQVGWIFLQMKGKQWHFLHQPWDCTLEMARAEDFCYLDPPYIGRHADYFNSWGEEEAIRFATVVRRLPCGFAVSMWLENRYRLNPHVAQCWEGIPQRVCSHFYHVGSTENLRNEMDETLLIRDGFATKDAGRQQSRLRRPESTLKLSLFSEDP